MNPPWAVLVTGPPCSGKSTLAGQLVAATGWVLLAKDPFKEILLDALGSGDADWSRRLSGAAFAVQLAVAEELLRAGMPLVLEGNFRQAEHGAFFAGLGRGRARLVQIACHADADVITARRRERAARATRHPGHRDAMPAGPDVDIAVYAALDITPTLRFDSGAGGGRELAGLLRRLAGLGVVAEALGRAQD